MEDGFWFSTALGLGTGGIYLLLVYLSLRLARGMGRRMFMMVVFGGMAIRLFVMASVIAIVIALASVSKVVYLAAFFVVFLIGLALEVVVVHRERSMPAQE
jgi:hypothetical protein